MSKYEGSVEKRILKAAEALFAEKGHEETRLREIAAAARTSESQIVKYFESKAGLLEALINEVKSRINDSFVIAQENSGEPVIILETLFTLLLDLFEKEPELFKVYLFSRRYYTLISEEQLLPEAQIRAQLSKIFKRGQKSKVFRNDFNPDTAASALWSAILGLMRDKFYAARSKDFPNFTREEIRKVMSMLIASYLNT